ncbi:MAG TPA: hypothetical protein VGR03_00170 [Candidatus Acidoferrum sp.]|nr:hypothetical protein [Candidatus Acidoferrum sp.]
MKRSWTALAVALVAILAVAGCNDYGNTFQNNTGASIAFLSPAQISACSANCADFTLTVNGRGFVAKTVVQWNGKSLPTALTLDSGGNIVNVTATVPAALVAKPGVATVITLNPAYGAGQNGLSNPIAFIINPPRNPVPVLTSTSLSPNNLTSCGSACGSGSFTLNISGTQFLSSSDPTQQSQVQWTFGSTQMTIAPSTVTSTSITVSIPNSFLATAGAATVSVRNPPAPSSGGGGGSSNGEPFNVCSNSQPCPPPSQASASSAAVAEETPAVSLDGRYVAFTGLENDRAQIFLRDTCEGIPSGCQPRTSLLSVAADGSAANEDSHAPTISADGRYVAFSSAATNLLENSPAGRQIYLRDTCAGAGDSCKPSTTLVSVDSAGTLVGTESILPSISSSGRFIAFLAITPSHSSNQVSAQLKTPASGNDSGYRQVFIRDTCLGAANCTPKTTRILLQPGDGTGSGQKSAGPALSGNARHVAIVAGNAATLFTRSVAVDDRVFLAIANQQH